MERDDDDIRTPSTSRSNSINDEEEEQPEQEKEKEKEKEEEKPSSRPSSPLHEETKQTGSTISENVPTDTVEKIDEIVAAKRTSFISSSSSSDSENDFVSVNKNDVDINGLEPIKINEPSITIEEPKDLSSNENHVSHEISKTTEIHENDSTTSDSDSDDDSIEEKQEDKKQEAEEENVFENKSSTTSFEVFASDEPLHTPFSEPIQEESEQSLHVDESEMIKSSGGDDEPWELDESGDYKIKPVPTSELSPSETKLEISKTSDDEQKSSDESEEENYDKYFSNFEPKENPETTVSKTVRFDDNLQNVAVLTPKDSLNESEASSRTNDSDEVEAENVLTDLQMSSDQITDYMNSDGITRRQIFPPPDSHISLTESEDLPPPLPPLPPLNKKITSSTENIPIKSILSSSSSNTDSKRKMNLSSETKTVPTIQPTTDIDSQSNTDKYIIRSSDSAILRSTSNNDAEIDPEEKDDVISCVVDNNQVKIDAKTISPFKCIVGSAGQLNDENQTILITLYGCWLPDRRLREYRYIMDQLFYYVYHKIEKLVTNDYILIYFHGATPKHRTPEIKFLRKCYQMINFRLRKNLRTVYVVHPTRWLRTVIAFSRPFFSNKFYHKVHYLYTIAELERQFPQNQISIPMIIEQTDWLYSQKYDRKNASIKRSIDRSQSPLQSQINLDSTA